MINVIFLVVNILFFITLKKYFDLDYKYRKLYFKYLVREGHLEYYRNKEKEDEE